MKYLIGLYLLLPIMTLAQKHDYIWLPGRGKVADWPFSGVNYQGGGVVMSFHSNPPSTRLQTFPLIMYPQAIISDKNGDLVAYTNGCHIANKYHQIMDNGDTINPGRFQKNVQCLLYYPTYQGTIFLPDPGQEGRYYLFHMALDYAGQPFLSGQRYYYSLIDAKANSGAGKVIDKNHLLLENGTVGGYVTATKHANGRDWWVISPERFSNKYYTFLLSPKGVEGPYTQIVGDSLPYPCCGMTIFSPDGSKYLRCTPHNGIKIFDFDRCTGQLSNQIAIDSAQTASSGPGGLAFSGDNRLLYVSTNRFLLQYDMHASDIAASKVVLAEIDWDPVPEIGSFHQSLLAPDGKIYMVSLNYVLDMPVVHFPERQGKACKAVQRGFRLPALYGNDFIFNFPHYRLGPLDGSPCDTLGLDNHPLANFRWEHEDSTDIQQVTFTDLSAYEPASWQWTFGDGNTSTERYPIHRYAQNGVYTACLVVKNQFSADTFCQKVYIGVTSAENPEIQNRIEVWPNPFSERLVLALSTPELRRPVLSLFDITGRLVLTERLEYGVNEINTSGLEKGLYFWAVEAGVRVGDPHEREQVKSGKVVKM